MISVALDSNAASAAEDEIQGTGSISAYFKAAPAKVMGIPYTNPNPETFNPSPPEDERYSAKERTVTAIPAMVMKFPRENPRISNGGSPALLTPAPPTMADLGADHP